ncbi:MAG: D-alanine--D-alanine ligase [Alphaproteobacteria bacterium]|nr:D-alanine--D-alanine ligase [Alphaproteobacteria bacterium]
MSDIRLPQAEIDAIIDLNNLKRVPKDTHVAVLMGGWSAERPVSIWSGDACAEALEKVGYKVTKIDVGRDVALRLAEVKPDVCFNALHGPFGEDGHIQGLLEILGIPYTHSDVLASAMAMNKHVARQLFAGVGIPIAKGKVINRFDAAKEHVMEPPYVLKPVADGSSFGVFIVPHGANQPPQELLAADWPLSDDMLGEQYVAGRELTCTVMGNRALAVTDIYSNSEFYDFEGKYAEGGSQHIVPAKIKPNIYQDIMKWSVRACEVLGCTGVARVDWRYDDSDGANDELICLEVNTQPGMTGSSLAPEQAQKLGISFEKFVAWMVEQAKCKQEIVGIKAKVKNR